MPTFQIPRGLLILLIVIIALVVLSGGYLAFLSTQGAPKSSPTNPPLETKEAVILEGTYVCLPNSDNSKTKECTPGLRKDDGEYVALDLGIVIGAGGDPKLTNGTKISAGGVLVPIEEVTGDQWDKYPVKDVMQVEEIAQQ